MLHDLYTTSREIARLATVASDLPRRVAAARAARDATALRGVYDEAQTIATRAPGLVKRAKLLSKAHALTLQMEKARRGRQPSVVRECARRLENIGREWQRTVQLPALGDFDFSGGYVTPGKMKDVMAKAIRGMNTAVRLLPKEGFGLALGALGDLGSASFVDGRDCPASGDWNTYCDCMFPAGAEREQCKQKYCAIFNPVSPGYCRADPRLMAAPWTEVGAGARGIRKQNAGVIYTATTTTNLPSPSEYEPDVLFKTAVYNWPRFAVLMGYAATVLSIGNPIVGIAATVSIGLNPGLAVTVWTTLPALAIPYAIAKGGQARLEANVLNPLADLGGDTLKLAVEALTGSWQAAVVAFFARRAAKNIGNNGSDSFSQSVKTLLLAIADGSQLFLNIAKDPQGQLSGYGAWAQIGQLLSNVGQTVPDALVKGVAITVGEVLDNFSLSLAELVKGNPQEALNQSTTRLIGASLSVIAKGGPDFAKLLANENGTYEKMGRMETGLRALSGAFQNMKSAMSGTALFDGVMSVVQAVWNAFVSLFTSLRNLVASWKQSGPSGTIAPNGAATLLRQNIRPALRPQTTTLAPNVAAKLVAANTSATGAKPKPKASGVIGGAVVGGTAGALVAGPPGALIGGAAGALISAAFKK